MKVPLLTGQPAPVIPFKVLIGRRQTSPDAPVITEITNNLRALLELKPSQVGGIRALVEHALDRARRQNAQAGGAR